MSVTYQQQRDHFWSGLLVGLLVGAAVAALNAPRRGTETRTLLRDRSLELKDRAVQAAQQAQDNALRSIDQLPRPRPPEPGATGEPGAPDRL